MGARSTLSRCLSRDEGIPPVIPRPVIARHRYVSGLVGLRTIDVAVVILYHLNFPGFVGGLLGVGGFSRSPVI